MSSWPSSAVDGAIAAAASFGSSFFPEQAASVMAALQASTIKRTDMACPFFYGIARGWAIRFAEHSMPSEG
jgi:hypothetical protein